MYKYILFDLDGTLTNPAMGITNSVMYALKKYNIEVKNREDLYVFIGPPLVDSFMKYYGFSKEESIQAMAYYREYFKDTGIYENEVIEGTVDLLEYLKAHDKKIILATSKPEEFAVRILKHFDLYKYFDFVGGATMDEKRSAKADVIKYVLDNYQIKDLSEAVMIGDRLHDIEGANKNHLDSIGVLVGFGDYKELEDAGATYIVETLEDIKRIVD